MRDTLARIWAVARKDLAVELRTREITSAMLMFAALAAFVFSLALDLRGAAAQAAAPGVLWVTVAFSGTLGLGRSLAREADNGALEGMLLAPMDGAVILAGKALANFLLMLVVQAALVPLLAGLLDAPLLRPALLPVLLLGTAGYAWVGTLLAAMAANTRAQEVALPILLLPLALPVLLAAVQATAGIIEGGDVAGWLRILAVYDLIMGAAGVATFEYVVRE